MASDQSGRWDDVRRALGRLVGRVTSHALPAAQTGIIASVRQTAFLRIEDAVAGARQSECSPSALIRGGVSAPSAPAGGGGVDLATVATVIGADRAFSTAGVVVFTLGCRFDGVSVHAGTLGRDGWCSSAVHDAPMRFADPQASKTGVIFDAPAVRLLPVVRAALPKPGREAKPLWQFAPARIRAGLAPVLRAPITCRRVTSPPGTPAAFAFAADRQLLAGAAGIPDADVALIGVFPHVPLGALRHLAVTPDGTALQILVRPEAVGRGQPVATVTIVLGRQRSTGKMLQAVRRGPGPVRR